MLFDRCILTKRDNEWTALVELRQRIGERWRFAAWVMLIILIIESFRLALAGFWYFNAIEYGILGLSLFFFIAFYRKSSKTFKYRETVLRIPPPEVFQDPYGNVTGSRQLLYLPENGSFKAYNVNQFTHVVFGLIDYPWPDRKDVFIDAFALYLAEKNGTPHAIVEGCFDKYTCYTLGRRISALTKLPLIELGKGQPFAKTEALEKKAS